MGDHRAPPRRRVRGLVRLAGRPAAVGLFGVVLLGAAFWVLSVGQSGWPPGVPLACGLIAASVFLVGVGVGGGIYGDP